MKARIVKKVLANHSHPKRESLVRQMMRQIESYGRMESRRLGLNPDRWGTYALSWPKRIRELMSKIRS